MYRYLPDPELQKLAAAARKQYVLDLVSKGSSVQVAEWYVGKMEEYAAKAVEKVFFETDTGGPLLGRK